MGRKFVLMVALAVWAAGALAQDSPRRDDAILAELKLLRQSVDALKAEVETLKQEKKEVDDEDVAPNVTGIFGSTRGANLAKLKKIKLPPNPTDDQVKDYLDQIAEASAGQSCFSSDDPQVKMYQKINPNKLPLLLDRMTGERNGTGYYHVREAVKLMARKQDKKLILDALPNSPELVSVVVKHHWETDAKDTLLEELGGGKASQLPPEWVQAVVNLEDPKTYDALKDYLVNGRNRYQTFQAINGLPGLDLTEAVKEVWENGGYDQWEMAGVAKIAFQFGHVDALDNLLDMLDDEKMAWQAQEIRPLLYRHLEVRGNSATLREWLKKNRGNIKFDPRDKKYKIAVGKTAAAPVAKP